MRLIVSPSLSVSQSIEPIIPTFILSYHEALVLHISTHFLEFASVIVTISPIN